MAGERQERVPILKRSWIVAAILSAAACGGGSAASRPVAILSRDVVAANEFRAISDARYEHRDANDEAKRALATFIERYKNDPIADKARALLVLVALDQRDFELADATLLKLSKLPPGSLRDFVTILRARELRLRKQPRPALELLRPLVGKIIEPRERDLLNEEVSRSAIEAGDLYESLVYMDTWLRMTTPIEHDATHETIARWIEEIDPAILALTLRSIRVDGRAVGYSEEMTRMMAARVADSAVARGDEETARWLLGEESVSSWLDRARETALFELTSARGEPAYGAQDPRAVGLVGLIVPRGDATLRDAVAEVARGLGWAFDWPPVPKGTRLTRLRMREVGINESTAAALTALSSDGVELIIAGFEPTSGGEAIAWANAQQVPVIALVSPTTNDLGPYGFLIDRRDAKAPRESLIRDFVRDFGNAPTTWTAIGHDAGALARGALEERPDDEGPDGGVPTRTQLRDALTKIDVTLWTSEAHAFHANHRLVK